MTGRLPQMVVPKAGTSRGVKLICKWFVRETPIGDKTADKVAVNVVGWLCARANLAFFCPSRELLATSSASGLRRAQSS